MSSECSSYLMNTDATRHMSYGFSDKCDVGLFGKGTWVRFANPAGTTIPTSPVRYKFCGTTSTGWYTGTYPSSAGSTSSGKVCYSWMANDCSASNNITITNCGSFYVFYLQDVPYCYSRYCTV